MMALATAFAEVVGEFGRERSGTDTGRVAFGDADDAADVARSEACAGAGSRWSATSRSMMVTAPGASPDVAVASATSY